MNILSLISCFIISWIAFKIWIYVDDQDSKKLKIKLLERELKHTEEAFWKQNAELMELQEKHEREYLNG